MPEARWRPAFTCFRARELPINWQELSRIVIVSAILCSGQWTFGRAPPLPAGRKWPSGRSEN